ncbi:uncharacterized protein LOC115754340 [Rhodamnia argentea]|uniref:Uncharacterized protein LOC115754340 n=1 Tax=Rhodamnia argentea TaxID=178133 RepID=A0ABM3H4R7_9MYRT|nr:uncharacterized protein LOC115754340 [Rhodamnia argentea]
MAKTESSQVLFNMAMSFCSNLTSLQQHPFNPVTGLPPLLDSCELLGLCGSNCSTFSDSCIDPLLDYCSGDCSYPNYLVPYFSSSPDNLVSISPDIFPFDELEYCPYPKRQKQKPLDYPGLVADGYVVSELPPVELAPPQLMLPPPPEPHLCGSYGGMEIGVKKPSVGGANLSTQSLAARQRRRKITEKTLELGKLVPGGRKMNTAEMLQAAYKYVKYLQAQVGILELKQSIQETQRSKREFQVLLQSPKIQEKLYAEEKCLATNELIRAIAKDPEVTTDPIGKEITQLMCTHGWFIEA